MIFVRYVLEKYRPDAVVHLGEQSSAPYSMMDVDHAVFTQVNNVSGTLNLIYAIRKVVPHCHLVKMGSMGSIACVNAKSNPTLERQTAKHLLSPRRRVDGEYLVYLGVGNHMG